ncbi:Ent-kaur-16-ene synthase, partial [Pseudocercospora fuligena]
LQPHKMSRVTVDDECGGHTAGHGGPTVDELSEMAASLLSRAAASIDPKYGFSTASCQIYDTAWVAMVTKTVEGNKNWLFPNSFHHLMSAQDMDGSWGKDEASQAAGILDTASALLCLMMHLREPLQIIEYSENEQRKAIEAAIESLRAQLAVWSDVAEANHIGIELIVPALLRYLKQEDPRLCFDFPCVSALEQMSSKKLENSKLEGLYGPRTTPVIYSLEALIGSIDFDRVSHQLFRNGSMWTSPASTAAYLMRASAWNDEAEAYLRHVMEHGQGHGGGAVPGTFPTHLFELNWIIATLLQAGYTLTDFTDDALDTIATSVRSAFTEGRGVIGHAIDADDTAKGLLAIKLMGKAEGIGPEALIRAFERHDGFSTFDDERNRSLSTNCHVLLTLLAWDTFTQHEAQILKVVTFITDYWWHSPGICKDKWARICYLASDLPLYARMLILSALTKTLLALDSAPVIEPCTWQELTNKMAIVMFQACAQTLLDQRRNGSWNDSREETAYAILALTDAKKLCFITGITDASTEIIDHIDKAIGDAVGYLTTSNKLSGTSGLWTSKTKYDLKFVTEGYVLAAYRAASHNRNREQHTIGLRSGLPVDFPQLAKFRTLLSKTTHFCNMAGWLLSASLIEGALWMPILRAKRLDVFPRDDKNIGKDAYLELLPTLWTGCIYRSMSFVPDVFIHDAIFMTLINIQVDEFIEGIATPEFESNTAVLHALIEEVVDRVAIDASISPRITKTMINRCNKDLTHQADCSSHVKAPCNLDNDKAKSKISGPLSRFVEFFLGHPRIKNANLYDRRRLELEIKNFLHAQTQQMEDNTRFAGQENETRFLTDMMYFQWVRTTASDHVSTPLSWAFICCWTSANLGHGAQVFSSPIENYLAAALVRHLATANRMYNDFGSFARDSAEFNVNSLHFREFHGEDGNLDYVSARRRLQALKSLADFEHACVEASRGSLEAEIDRANPRASDQSFAVQKLRTVGLLCDVASLWDQIYCLRDLSSSIYSRREGSQ